MCGRELFGKQIQSKLRRRLIHTIDNEGNSSYMYFSSYGRAAVLSHRISPIQSAPGDASQRGMAYLL